MRTRTIAVLCVVCFLVTTSISAETQGDCTVSNFPVQANFNLEKFLGKWYELAWIPETWIPPEKNFRDFFFDYTQFNATALDISWLGRVKDSSAYCVAGSSRLYTTEEGGKFMYERVYNSSGARLVSIYWVIVTDYENYALTYGCRQFNSSGACVAPDAWTWSRTRQLDPKYEAIMVDALPRLCLTEDQFIITNQNRECTPKPTSLSHGNSMASPHLLLLLLVLLLAGTNLSPYSRWS